jgi:hypothetical protein
LGDGGGGAEFLDHAVDEAEAGFEGLWREDFCDGGDGAEVFIEDEVFDEVVCIVCVGVGGDGVTAGGAGVAAGVAADVAAAGAGFAAVAAGCGGAGFVEVPDGQFEGVEDGVGALWVELPSGEAVEDLGESELDALAVVDQRHLEDGLLGVDSTMARGGAAGGVVVVAELLAAQRGRAAAAARGEDVTALKALRRGFRGWRWVGRCGFGCVRHGMDPPGVNSVKYSKNVS